ncbi:hypothetical protein EX30DRAFT_333192 [Ascodesmis nigricans]|uniref:BSD domain-containing protein n=1 Tax=Ascodesmis nigricans TaxID=341454 RepID=A0A4S2MT24_9PEZI|nr:hypothetical protein EX30DRAFT_333192 [Ascodesmis nigricans]
MDLAYDYTFQKSIESSEAEPKSSEDSKGKQPAKQEETLSEEFQQAYKAISNSPWGAKFGAFAGSVWKQADSTFQTAKGEYGPLAEQATKNFNELRSNIVTRTRGLSLSNPLASSSTPPAPASIDSEKAAPTTTADGASAEGTLFSKLRSTAAKKLTELEEAEKRADEYLAKFGSQIGAFLRDAVTIAPPEESDSTGANQQTELLFETKAGSTAGKQIYTSRLDAQLHLLHTNVELFKEDPKPEGFKTFSEGFKVDAKETTERIAADLERYPELRKAMEALVPETVEYAKFWVRYYFFREELDKDEQKRKELLKGAALEEEEVGWDEEDESEDESEEESSEEESDEDSDEEGQSKATATAQKKPSTDTLLASKEPKKSTDGTSQPDSEASYDLVSGAPSKAASQGQASPKPKGAPNDEDSDDDWE